jgi:hypothetical protein
MKLTVLGIVLALIGLAVSYFTYDPDQYQAVAVYRDGRQDTTHAFFKSEQDCNAWATNQASMMSQAMAHNPNTQYVGIHTYRCSRFCPNKMECILKDLTG